MNIKVPSDSLTDMLQLFQGPCLPKSVLLALVLFAVVFCGAAAKCLGQTNLTGNFTGWSVSEFQPNIQEGGRANTFAVHPTNNNIIFVTSETGGLFRSSDWGARWQHVDSLPCFRTNSVAFAPGDSTILIVTTGDDFKTAGGGGIWR